MATDDPIHSLKRRLAQLLGAPAAIALLTACHSATVAKPGVGEYFLLAIDRQALPASGNADTSIVLSSWIDLLEDGGFTFVRLDSFPLAPGASNDRQSISGTWTLNGDTIRMIGGSQGGSVEYTATLSGSQLQLRPPGEGLWAFQLFNIR